MSHAYLNNSCRPLCTCWYRHYFPCHRRHHGETTTPWVGINSSCLTCLYLPVEDDRSAVKSCPDNGHILVYSVECLPDNATKLCIWPIEASPYRGQCFKVLNKLSLCHFMGVRGGSRNSSSGGGGFWAGILQGGLGSRSARIFIYWQAKKKLGGGGNPPPPRIRHWVFSWQIYHHSPMLTPPVYI